MKFKVLVLLENIGEHPICRNCTNGMEGGCRVFLSAKLGWVGDGTDADMACTYYVPRKREIVT
jgi:hypothetical protein